MRVVATINNRRIKEQDPLGVYPHTWWVVELRGPTTNRGEALVVWRKRDTLAEAIAEAERLGPMTDQPDDLSDGPDFSKLKCEQPLPDTTAVLEQMDDDANAQQISKRIPTLPF